MRDFSILQQESKISPRMHSSLLVDLQGQFLETVISLVDSSLTLIGVTWSV